LYAGEAAVADWEKSSADNSAGVIDHLALQAIGFNQIHQAILDNRLNWQAQNSNLTNENVAGAGSTYLVAAMRPCTPAASARRFGTQFLRRDWRLCFQRC
jgi:hypothetical protein